ncbi:hypothetical protein CO046_01670 [Candidatus Peregrinibacteria bacterium CG_4_9_14_0_2_um_filter_53_11]|nr:MAG: hypothetical protein CO046_01670 [Candidatus Peregrinibacteria bacterium CG_4_9_14_0_2_um_filter_53_11]
MKKSSKNRLVLIDILRGSALVGMVVFHALFILDFYGIQNFDLFSGGWDVFGTIIRLTFLGLAGVSVGLSYERHNSRARIVKHGEVVLLAGLAITLATRLSVPGWFVRFGILHLIGVSILILSVVGRRPRTAFIMGIAVLIMTPVVASIRGSGIVGYSLGMAQSEAISSLDYFPLFPWFGFIALGMWLGHYLMRYLSTTPTTAPLPVRPLIFMGRHALMIYMTHVPLIIAAFIVLGILPLGSVIFTPENQPNGPTEEVPRELTISASNLSIPWEVAPLSNGELLVTERTGSLVKIDPTSQKRITIEGVHHSGEGGLLGLALHPNFENNHRIYLYLTTLTSEGTRNRVESYLFDGKNLSEQLTIIEGIPGSRFHDGGRIAFGPDGLLYITTGDAQNSANAQEINSLAGKILRLTDTGEVPTDNPFNNAVYSYGHRNPQGLAWDSTGRLWATEHGRSGVSSGFDELNKIEKGGNYGWPTIEGGAEAQGLITPAAHSGATTTWAPADALYYKGSIFFTGLRGESLYEAVINEAEGSVTEIKTHLVGQFGRLRGLALNQDETSLFITTSNTDGRGVAADQDDRLIKLPLAAIEGAIGK